GRLTIPYWFMDSDDFVRLFRASPGVQRPVLLHALSSARLSATEGRGWLDIRDAVIKECNRILALCSTSDKADARAVRQLCDEMSAYLASPSATAAEADLFERYPEATLAGL